MNSHILHITNDYSGSTVYKNLVREIDLLGFRKPFILPFEIKIRLIRNLIEFESSDSKIYYRNILKLKDRIQFSKKIRKIVRDIENSVDLDIIHLIHAHTWFSDGAVAYELSKKLKIPYMIAIRGTDVDAIF